MTRSRLITVRILERADGSRFACVQYGRSRWFFTLPEELEQYAQQVMAVTRFAAVLPGALYADAREQRKAESDLPWT